MACGRGRRAAHGWAGLALLVLWAGAAGGQEAADPVEDLQAVLRDPSADPTSRDRALQNCFRRLRGLADMQRALGLEEWRGPRTPASVTAVDRANRAALIQAFTGAARQALREGSPAEAATAAEVLAQRAVASRSSGERPELLRTLAPDLAALVAAGEPPVRAAAARALGQIEPDPAVAVPALSELLQSHDADLRQAAADGLAGLMQALLQSSAWTTAAEAVRGQTRATAAAVTPVAGRGLADADVAVRRRCVQALALASVALARLASGPPEDVAEDDAAAVRRRVLAEWRPLALALREQVPALARALHDRDRDVRILAAKAAEELAQARWRWLRLAPQEAADDPLLAALQAAAPALGAAAADPEVQVRRAALDALEMLGPIAAPEVPALVRVLADPDRSARRSAVRILGRLGPAAAAAIPGLSSLLEDPDLDLRVAAAGALEGLTARPPGVPETAGSVDVLPALMRSLRSRDLLLRLAVLRTLRAMRGTARLAAPAVCAVLGDPDARVRRAAAETLGALGPAGGREADLLREALADPSTEVRQAARMALLDLGQPSSR
jgi:HEAT repeat protein